MSEATRWDVCDRMQADTARVKCLCVHRAEDYYVLDGEI